MQVQSSNFQVPSPVCNMASRVKPIETSEDHKENKFDFIDNQLLKAKQYTIDTFGCQKEFVIDGKVFKDNIKVDDTFREFELYWNNLKMDENADNSCVSMDEDTCLSMYIQPVPYGIIINSNVYLTEQQWNTLYPISEELHRCAVCDTYCDKSHLTSSVHKANLDRYKPLNKYDLTVTRKIGINYHCGVCNQLFDQSIKDEHFSSKNHEDKMLFAINKVSDIMYDFNIHNNNNLDEKKDFYHFNARAINNDVDNDNNDVSSEDESDVEYNDNWNQFNTLKCNDNGDDDYYYEAAPNLAHSYASMARKPKTEDLPAVLEIDLGNKKVTVKFDSWNMVITPQMNRFYCMACKTLDHVRRKAEHCRSEEHLAKLDQCTVVDEYEMYLVRQVNDKLYHCGHCNNLQLIHEMEDHIESQHISPKQTQLFDSPTKKISSPVKTSTPAKTVNNANDATANAARNDILANGHDNRAKMTDNQPRITNNQSKMNDNLTRINDNQPGIGHNENNVIQTNLADMYDRLRSANSNFDDIVICAYGMEIRISKLAFNIVCQGENDFYCGLCEVNIGKDRLKLHIGDLQHLIRLQRTPFIEAFNMHLFREIRDALHCALCNELIQVVPEYILKHKFLEKHIVSLGRASRHINDKTVTAEAKNVETTVNNNVAVDETKSNKVNVPKTPTKEANRNNVMTKDTTNVAANTNTQINKNVALSNIPAIKKDLAFNNVPINKTKSTVQNSGPNITSVTKECHKKDAKAKLEAEIIAAQTQAKNEEYVIVRNGVKEGITDDLDESFIDDHDFEEYVYVKLGNTYIKITNTSYNTLVDVGDGSKYCFVCSFVVDGELKKHIENRGHMENMEKFKFVDKYNEDLLRQFYLMYHCSICNVVITRKQLNHHLTWPTHALQTENTKISSKKRKNEIKTGTKQIPVATQKENIYLNEKETDIKIYLNIVIEKERVDVNKKNKIVIFNDNVLKVGFDCWHSVSEIAGGYRCKVCQCEFDENEFGAHVSNDWHKGNTDKIEKQYSPALIRKINDTTLNCIVCNTEVSNKKHIVTEHIQGKKHLKHYDAILKDSSVANSYADCDEDVLML